MDDLFKMAVLLVTGLIVAGMAAAQVEISSASVDPAMVEGGETVGNQVFTLDVEGLSADGDVDYVYFEFPDEFSEEDLSVNSLESDVSVDESAELTDRSEDGERRTVVAGLNPDEGEEVGAEIVLDISVTYPEEFESMTVNAEVEDSQGDSVTESIDVEATMEQDVEEEPQNETGNETVNETDDELGPINESDEGPTEMEPEETEEESEGIIASIVSFFRGLFSS